MHISDGVLSVKWSIIWYLVAGVFILIGLREIEKGSKVNPAYKPMVAIMGAAVFVISIWHIPVPVTGSSSHPIGTPMSAIVIGAFPTVVLTAIGLFFHMFLAHGGVTTLGANTVSMGIVGAFSGLAIFLVLKELHAPLWLAAGSAGLVGDILTYATTALELALSLNPGAVGEYWAIYFAGFSFTQVPLALLEFAFTAAVVHFIATAHPELLRIRVQTPQMMPGGRE